MDFWDYCEQRKRECEELGLTPRPPDTDIEQMFVGGPEGEGRMFGRLDMREDAYIQVSEVIVATGEQGRDIHRESYAYFLILDGKERCARERDPSHGDMPEHGHGPDHERFPTGRVPFKKAVELAWESLKAYDREKKG
jgi:hypothetical protein